MHLKASITLSCLDTYREKVRKYYCVFPCSLSQQYGLFKQHFRTLFLLWTFISSFFPSVPAQLFLRLQYKLYNEIDLTKKMKKPHQWPNFSIFYTSHFPDTIHREAVGRIILAGLAVKPAAM